MRRFHWLPISLLLPNAGLVFYSMLGYEMGGLRQAVDFGLRWGSFSVLYWLPIGLFLTSERKPRERWLGSLAISLPAYFACLLIVYPMAGSRFRPSSAGAWGSYVAGALVMFVIVAGLARLAAHRSWISNTVLAVAAALFLVGMAGPISLLRNTDRYLWPTDGPSQLNLVNGKIVMLPSGEVVTGKNLHIDRGRIAAIVDSVADTSAWPKLDANGGFVMPGMIDVHTHLDSPLKSVLTPFDFGYLLDAEFSLMADHRRAYLESGVTCVRDLGGPAMHTFAWRRAVASHRLLGPRIFAAGRLVTSPDGHPVSTIWAAYPYLSREGAILPVDAVELRRGLERNEAEGPSDAVKIVFGTIGRARGKLSLALLQEGIRWATERGKISVVHAETAEEVSEAAVAGATGVEHVASAGELSPGLVAQLAKNRTFVDPTFGEYAVVLTLTKTPEPERQRALAASYRTAQKLAAAGVSLAAGTDAPLVPYGTGFLDEIGHFANAGFRTADILTIVTLNNAAYLGQRGFLGCMQVGCSADLLVLRDNPLENLAALKSLELVLREGVPVIRNK